MAALYSGIHLKLKSSGTPWENKLKLARFAFISSQCLLPNKEQVLLDWTTHALTGFYTKKVEFSESVLKGLWCYLDELLHSRKLRSLLNQGKTITLKLNVTQVLLDRLQECVDGGPEASVSVSTLLSVYEGILSSPTLSSIFTTKYDLLAELLAGFCRLACHRLDHRGSFAEGPLAHTFKPTPESATSQDDLVTKCLQSQPTGNITQSELFTIHPPDETVADSNVSCSQEHSPPALMFDVLLQVLSCYLAVQRQQVNAQRVFTVVTNHLFQPIILLRHLLSSAEPTPLLTSPRPRPQLCKEIRHKIDSILQLALFPPEQETFYMEELLPKEDSGKSGPVGVKGLPKPLKSILCKLGARGYCEPSLPYSVKTHALSLLFRLCVESYGKSGTGVGEEQRMLCFHFLTKIVPALDMDLDSPASAAPMSTSKTPQPESWSQALLTLEALLNLTLSSDIYNVAADRIRHSEVQLQFYRALVQILFQHSQPSIPAWYRCLKILLGLNHLILEPDLDQLLSLAWVDSDCMESRVQRARELLVCSLFHTYTKLHQLPCLFSELLTVVCWPTSDDLRPPLLTDEICTSIKTSVLDTSPSQASEICSLILASIKRYILPDLEKDKGGENRETAGEDAAGMEIDGTHRGKNGKVTTYQDGKIIEQESEKRDATLKLLSHSWLLHVVLFSLETLDNASPVPLVRQTTSLMKEMSQVVSSLLQLVTLEKTPSNVDLDTNFNVEQKNKLDRSNAKNPSDQDGDPCVLWKQKALEAALLLRYSWVEVDALFHIHCSRYTPQESTSGPALSKTDHNTPPKSVVLSHLKALLSGEILPERLLPFPNKTSSSAMSSWLLKLLALQQLKKVLLDSHLLANPETAAILRRAAQFVLAKEELTDSLKKDLDAARRTEMSVNSNSYPVAHWYLVTSSLPLIAPYLAAGDEGCVADVVLSSLLSRMTNESKEWLPVFWSGSHSILAISSQLLQSPLFVELPSLYSATVRSLTLRIMGVLSPAHQLFENMNLPAKVSSFNQCDKDVNEPLINSEKSKALVEEILRSSQTGEVSVVLSHAQTQDLLNLINLAANLNPDGINSEDLSSLFLILLFVLTSTTSGPDGAVGEPDNQGNETLLMGKLLRLLTCLLESSNFQNVLKLIHGSSLLQAVVSSLLSLSSKERFCSTRDNGWVDLVKEVQVFVKCLVHLIIIRNSSVRLNLEQFTSYLASNKIARRQLKALTAQTAPNVAKLSTLGTPEPGTAIFSLQLLMASLTSFSQAMEFYLGRSKQLDQTLTKLITKNTAALGPIIETILKPQAISQPGNQQASILGQAFLVEVVTAMLQCELSTLPVELADEQNIIDPVLSQQPLYHSFCQQIIREISSAPRPNDFLVSSLRFMSAYYCMVKRKAGEKNEADRDGREELKELYTQILQKLYTLLAAHWLSSSELCELEPAVQELLCHLLDGSTVGQFNLLLLMIREGLDVSKLGTGLYKEVLSAVTVARLLSCCPLPEACSKALWLVAPQIMSSMVFIVKSSSQDITLTQPLTVPTVTAVTSLLRQGRGLISNPHHVTLVLGALHLTPLDRLTPPVYRATFQAVHEALFAIISCHPQVLVSAAPSFLTVFYRLVASIMHEGRQKGDSDAGVEGDVYLQCSRLVERMYTHMAASAEVFTNFSAFMVAQYVTELQKVTLRPDVKLHLTEGIYQIMDLCLERDIKFLTAGLQTGVREVFNELYSSYTHYHKAQRQGEGKYAA